MQTRGAVLRKAPSEYEIVELELDEPWADEIEVQMVASGLCHTDDHFACGSIALDIYPMAGGHEGAGIVTKARQNRKGINEGDHVVFTFVPSCGYCRWCATGQQNLCDQGAHAVKGSRFTDSTSYRLHAMDGNPVGQMNGISTFVEHTVVSIDSVVKIRNDMPLNRACLLGCGVGTGWGSAVNSADVKPGHTVIVMGIGGIGINAVQGARHAGATNVIAVDPVAFKRAKAIELGATHAFASIDDAALAGQVLTNGQGADSAIVTIGVTLPRHVAQAFSAIRKAGTVVVTGVGDSADVAVPVSLTELVSYQKRIQGSLFGACNPTWDIPRQIELYRDGVLRLDELVTNVYALDDISRGFRDMHNGTNIRGVLVFD
jgi:NDMA-dependent alcohol dehydrogenase